MALRAVKSRSLGDQIFQQLAGEILGRSYAPHDSLPSERELAVVFGVNRHVVREALKRLEQVGLVKIAQGGRTTVRDFMLYAGLDLVEMMSQYARAGRDVRRLWLAVQEMRSAVCIDVARLCALRADAATRDEILNLSHQMREALSEQDILRIDLRFWERILHGADNLVYRLAFNSFVRAVSTISDVAAPFSAHEVRSTGFRLEIAQAIARGDAAAAEECTRTVLRQSLALMERLVEQDDKAEAGGAPTSDEDSSEDPPRARQVVR